MSAPKDDKKSTETTGEKIVKAVQEERARLVASRPYVTTKLGFDGTGFATVPVMEIVIKGGDPDLLQALGIELQKIALDRLSRLTMPTRPTYPDVEPASFPDVIEAAPES